MEAKSSFGGKDTMGFEAKEPVGTMMVVQKKKVDFFVGSAITARLCSLFFALFWFASPQ